MADNILIWSKALPLKMTEVGFVNPAPYNTKYFEDFKFEDTLTSLDEKVVYLQPWQKNDIIYLVFLSNFDGHSFELVDCNGNLIQSYAGDYVSTSIEITGLKCFKVEIALDTFDAGTYQLKGFHGDDGSGGFLINTESEFFDLRVLHENSVQMAYTHDENDFDIPFEIDVEFIQRYYGGVVDWQGGGESTVFVDQIEDMVQLKNKTFYTAVLIVGGWDGVAPWQMVSIWEAWRCSQVKIDGKQWVKPDGAHMEPTREEYYPKAAWRLEIREADKQDSKRFVKDGDTGGGTSVVYNIESRGFGPIEGPASSNVIQIEALN